MCHACMLSILIGDHTREEKRNIKHVLVTSFLCPFIRRIIVNVDSVCHGPRVKAGEASLVMHVRMHTDEFSSIYMHVCMHGYTVPMHVTKMKYKEGGKLQED